MKCTINISLSWYFSMKFQEIFYHTENMKNTIKWLSFFLTPNIFVMFIHLYPTYNRESRGHLFLRQTVVHSSLNFRDSVECRRSVLEPRQGNKNHSFPRAGIEPTTADVTVRRPSLITIIEIYFITIAIFIYFLLYTTLVVDLGR